jgi:hypothetical protein
MIIITVQRCYRCVKTVDGINWYDQKMIKLPWHKENNRWCTCRRKKKICDVSSSLSKMAIGKVVVKGLILKRMEMSKSSVKKSSNKLEKCIMRICR